MNEWQNNTLLTSVHHGETVLKENKFVVPIALYFDDFEVSTPLESRKSVHKLSDLFKSIESATSIY